MQTYRISGSAAEGTGAGGGSAVSVDRFYDELAPFYHLIFPDWETSIRRQAETLDAVIRERWGDSRLSILDVACGIGTQALGLAALGHRVTASDISAGAVERAVREAGDRGLAIRFSVADMRRAADHHRKQFDLVITCDNAIPHLLTDEELVTTFGQFLACTRPGGGCLVTVRDYDREDRAGVQVKPYGVRDEGGVRYLLWQVWEFRGPVYDLAMYCVADRGGSDCTAWVMRSRYYAVGTDKLRELMRQAGFVQVERIDGRFYQPILLGRRSAEPGGVLSTGILDRPLGGERGAGPEDPVADHQELPHPRPDGRHPRLTGRDEAGEVPGEDGVEPGGRSPAGTRPASASHIARY